MTAPTVEAAIHKLMDLAWNVVYDLLQERGLLEAGLFVEEYTVVHSGLEGPTRYTVVHSATWPSYSWTHGRWTPSPSITTSWALTTRPVTSRCRADCECGAHAVPTKKFCHIGAT
jgi:hypothetical protein